MTHGNVRLTRLEGIGGTSEDGGISRPRLSARRNEAQAQINNPAEMPNKSSHVPSTIARAIRSNTGRMANSSYAQQHPKEDRAGEGRPLGQQQIQRRDGCRLSVHHWSPLRLTSGTTWRAWRSVNLRQATAYEPRRSSGTVTDIIKARTKRSQKPWDRKWRRGVTAFQGLELHVRRHFFSV